MTSYIEVEKVSTILAQILAPEYAQELQEKLEKESLDLPGKVQGNELKQTALILQLIQKDIAHPLQKTCERLLRTVSSLSSPPNFPEETVQLAEGLSAILQAAGE